MFWTTAFSLALSAGALVGLFISLRQTWQALKDSRTNSELQNQAYVYVEGLEYGSRSWSSRLRKEMKPAPNEMRGIAQSFVLPSQVALAISGRFSM